MNDDDEKKPAPPPTVVLPDYGDERIARDHSLAVMVEARMLLHAQWTEDDLFKRPRRTFTADQLEDAYDRATDIVAKKKRLADEQQFGSPLADVAGEIQAVAARLMQQAAKLVCGGYVDRVHLCTDEVMQRCEKRDAPMCPRQIIRYERLLERARNGDKPPPKPEPPKTPEQRLLDCGVPEDVVKQLLVDPWDPRLPAMKEVEAWYWILDDDRPPFLLLAGAVGNGKSTSAAWAIQQRAFDGMWVSAYRLAIAAQLKQEPFIAQLCATPLLVIDDLGAEETTEGGKSLVNRLAYERGAKDTIITINLPTPDILRERYGERFFDRVRNGGRARVAPGGSMRGKRKKKGD